MPALALRFGAGETLTHDSQLGGRPPQRGRPSCSRVDPPEALRYVHRRGRVAPFALRHLAGLPVRRMPLAPQLDRMWALRANVTAYDAAYVTLAEQLAAPIITCDAGWLPPVELAAPSM